MAAARSAYTLFELILVLSVMVLVSGLAWSGVTRLYRWQQIREAAEVVRSTLADCRLHATETGQIIQFRFRPGGRHYEVLAGELSPIDLEQTVDGITALPETMRFELIDETARAELVSVLFSPDGTATAAAWDLMDEHDTALRISVRDLTAAISVRPVEQAVAP